MHSIWSVDTLLPFLAFFLIPADGELLALAHPAFALAIPRAVLVMAAGRAQSTVLTHMPDSDRD